FRAAAAIVWPRGSALENRESMIKHCIFSFAVLIWPIATEAASFTTASAFVDSADIGITWTGINGGALMTGNCTFTETNTGVLSASAAVACLGVGNRAGSHAAVS